MDALHGGLGHQGVERTEQMVRQRCYWPGLAKDVKTWVSNCERCILAKKGPSIKTPMGTDEVLAVDFTVLEPAPGGIRPGHDRCVHKVHSCSPYQRPEGGYSCQGTH